MPNVRNNGWCRIEGCEISDLFRQYGTLHYIPNSEQHIYYGSPEIQIDNPTSDTHSTIYAVKNISTTFGYTQIHDIDDNWNVFINNINTWMNNNLVDKDDPDTAYYYVNKPFTVSQSCVIFYDDSSKSSITGSKYTHYAIILIDEHAISHVINVTAKYKGDAVPVGETIDIDTLEVIAQYDDGNEIKVKSGYFIEPGDRIVTQLGANLFQLYYTDPENDVNRTTFIVQGCRNLQSIDGYWDGPQVAFGKAADRKYFVIIAHYSDDTESTVTEFEFPNSNFVTKQNNGLIDIIYKGRSCQIQVPTFEVKQSRLIAYYSGPQVELGNEFQLRYLSVRIYYSSDTDINKSYYETVNVEDCIIDNKEVSKLGNNVFNVSYEGALGLLTTSFIVVGFNPEVKPTDIQVSYTGPDIYQGDTFNIERVICNIYYNNGTIKTVKNFTLSTNIIHTIGVNEITVTYTENTTTLTGVIFINGLEKDTTTDNNIFPTSLNNNYPRATILNNRYRGPAEGIKTNNYANMIIKNVNDLYKLFVNVEKQYNQLIQNISNDNNTKISTLNYVSLINYKTNQILNDEHYTTGRYKAEDVIR